MTWQGVLQGGKGGYAPLNYLWLKQKQGFLSYLVYTPIISNLLPPTEKL